MMPDPAKPVRQLWRRRPNLSLAFGGGDHWHGTGVTTNLRQERIVLQMGWYVTNPYRGHLVSDDATHADSAIVGRVEHDRAVLAKHPTEAPAGRTAAVVADHEIQVVVTAIADEHYAVAKLDGNANAFQSLLSQALQRRLRFHRSAVGVHFWAIQHRDALAGRSVSLSHQTHIARTALAPPASTSRQNVTTPSGSSRA
ncbi:MAG TPA: hypothetical protein VGN51_19300 [Acidimicrobiia bacterium]